jgi:Galactose-3-O-sulfotransferase
VEELNFIMTEYDFIGVTERLDESLIVFMLLLHLPMSDILYYSSKIQGDLFSRQVGQPCVRLQRSRLTPNITAFLESPEWKAKVESDERLYRAANASLDRTIDSLGRAMVVAELGRFKKAQAVVNERCRGRVVMPCDEKGQLSRPVPSTRRGASSRTLHAGWTVWTRWRRSCSCGNRRTYSTPQRRNGSVQFHMNRIASKGRTAFVRKT